jgi:hypothetical protein
VQVRKQLPNVGIRDRFDDLHFIDGLLSNNQIEEERFAKLAMQKLNLYLTAHRHPR